jgi:exosome complex component RRP4
VKEKRGVNMSELIKNDREVVLPGEEIINSIDYLPGKNSFREGNSIYSKRIGLVSVRGRVISVIPLSGVYIPRADDMVIGEVEEIQTSGWVVNINSFRDSFLPLSGVREFIDTTKTDLSKFYAVGDVIYAKINHASFHSIQLSMQDPKSRKFRSGRIVSMSPAKVPRLIGKEGSMINVIKDKAGCRINVGQNGLVWFEGEKEDLVVDAIRLIEREAAMEGLTERVSSMLNSKDKQTEKA